MYAIRSYYALRFSNRLFAVPDLKIPFCRITSYNVCYTKLLREDLDANEATLKNARLWDYRPLQQTYAQLQELRPYYEFSDVDIDRYDINGETRQVMLAGRELNKQNP